MRQLSAPALRQMLDTAGNEKPVLIDVREAWEYNLAHITGATHMPMNDVPSRIQELDETHPTVVICHHGMRSLQVVAYLERMGFDNLHNLDGGIDAWSRQVDASVSRY
jgi:rhodanese-related sulfurtransferase